MWKTPPVNCEDDEIWQSTRQIFYNGTLALWYLTKKSLGCTIASPQQIQASLWVSVRQYMKMSIILFLSFMSKSVVAGRGLMCISAPRRIHVPSSQPSSRLCLDCSQTFLVWEGSGTGLSEGSALMGLPLVCWSSSNLWGRRGRAAGSVCMCA